jgi:hypothetical protein
MRTLTLADPGGYTWEITQVGLGLTRFR